VVVVVALANVHACVHAMVASVKGGGRRASAAGGHHRRHTSSTSIHVCYGGNCQVRVYSGRGSSQVRTKADKGQGQGAGQGVSPAGVGDRLDSTTKDNEH